MIHVTANRCRRRDYVGVEFDCLLYGSLNVVRSAGLHQDDVHLLGDSAPIRLPIQRAAHLSVGEIPRGEAGDHGAMDTSGWCGQTRDAGGRVSTIPGLNYPRGAAVQVVEPGPTYRDRAGRRGRPRKTQLPLLMPQPSRAPA